MIKFRFSNISTGMIIFVAIIFLPGLFALSSGIYSLNILKNSTSIHASVDSVFLKEETVGMFRNGMIDYQIGILKTNEYPCSFNIGEVKDSSIIKSLVPKETIIITIKQKDSLNLFTSNQIELLRLTVTDKEFISLEKTISRKHHSIDMRIQLGVLAIIISLLILGIAGCKKQ